MCLLDVRSYVMIPLLRGMEACEETWKAPRAYSELEKHALKDSLFLHSFPTFEKCLLD